MAKIHPLGLFIGGLSIALILALFIHLSIVQPSHPSINLIPPYLVNFSLAALITTIIYVLRNKYAQSLGFIFMGSSFLKFAIYFFFFNPLYKEDGNVEAYEFAQFFVPYAISLTIETIFLVRILNKTSNSETK